MLAYDRSCTLWDAARLLSVGEEGYAFRARVAARLRTRPELKEISEFFAAELSAQLADARSTTTAKLDAPVNKLARLLNSPSIKRVLRNDSLRVDFDRLIAHGEVLVVKGALGTMGAGNTSVLMQLLVGMLDAALARQQDGMAAEERVAVALKVDEAPLVLNRGFAETMALKRSAGLETVACWQADSQWTDREVRAQLDALFAHRVYFATASVQDARGSTDLMMAEYSDMVRPGIRNLSALGHPDVRLHLPKHSAIVSWVTPRGRAAPFIAQTVPMRVSAERLAHHAACQAARGGRYLEDLSEPHWERRHEQPNGESAGLRASGADAGKRASGADAGERGPRGPGEATVGPRPATPAESYRELVDLEAAVSVRRVAPPSALRSLQPDSMDVEILALIASMGHVLSSQIHKRFNEGRSATTTQRRLKRLSDAGLVERFQLHRRDGGGVPMCYAISPHGLRLLQERSRAPLSASGAGELDEESTREGGGGERERLTTAMTSEGARERRLARQATRDVRIAGWALAVERALAVDRGSGKVALRLRGRLESALCPPSRSTPNGPVALSPAWLRLPGGRTPHDLLRTLESGARVELEHFQTIRPDVTIALDGGARTRVRFGLGLDVVSADGHSEGLVEADELMVELDDRLPEGTRAAKLERYDHFLAGWALHVKRYRAPAARLPFIVFVCRDRARARECARRADRVLTACRAYPGEYPASWEYPGRERVVYAAERDAHEGLLDCYGVGRLPPEVRVAAGGGDPRGRDPVVERRRIEMPSAEVGGGSGGVGRDGESG